MLVKQIWAASLLFLLLLQSYGAILLYCFVVQPICHYQAQKNLEQKTLISFRFSVDAAKTQLQWQHPKEFIYQHKLYDVRQQYTQNDTLHITAHFDGVETNCLVYLQQYWQNLNQPNNNSNKSLPIALSCLLLVYIAPQILSLLPPIGNIQPVNSYYLRLSILFYPSVAVPPPQNCYVIV